MDINKNGGISWGLSGVEPFEPTVNRIYIIFRFQQNI
jgi:hypothetical protein